MTRFAKTNPGKTLKWEPQRKQMLSKLRVVYEMYGLKTIGELLISSASHLHDLEEWKRGRKSIYHALRDLGVLVVQKEGRKFRVTDKEGSFHFQDDVYYSGLYTICYPLVKLGFAFPEQLPTDREPRSFNTTLPKIRDVLSKQHREGVYGPSLKHDLLGGSFTSYRQVLYRESPISIKPDGYRVQKSGATEVVWTFGEDDLNKIIDKIDDPNEQEFREIVEIVNHHTGFCSLHDHICRRIDKNTADRLFRKGRGGPVRDLGIIYERSKSLGLSPIETVAACVRKRNLILNWDTGQNN